MKITYKTHNSKRKQIIKNPSERCFTLDFIVNFFLSEFLFCKFARVAKCWWVSFQMHSYLHGWWVPCWHSRTSMATGAQHLLRQFNSIHNSGIPTIVAGSCMFSCCCLCYVEFIYRRKLIMFSGLKTKECFWVYSWPL